MDDPWFGLDEAMELLRARLNTRRMEWATRPPPPQHKTTRTKTGESEAMAEVRSAELEETKQKLRQAHEENIKLQAVISDLTQVNKRWQRYNSERQVYVQSLLSTIQDQQVQINNIGELKAFPHNQEEKEGSGECPRTQCGQQKEELKRLQEQVALLQYQVRAHKEDWEAERSEKSQALSQRDSANQRLAHLISHFKGFPGEASRGAQGEPSRGHSGCEICKEDESDSRKAPAATNPTTHRRGCEELGGELECDGGAQVGEEERLGTADGGAAGLSQGAAGTAQGAAGGLRPREENYSQASTLPLASPKVSPSGSGGSVGGGYNLSCQSSWVQLPVMKSSSAPERRSSSGHGRNKPPKCVSLSVIQGTRGAVIAGARPRRAEPPVLTPGVDTQTREDIKCPSCHRLFPPHLHLDFIDHFDSCHPTER